MSNIDGCAEPQKLLSTNKTLVADSVSTLFLVPPIIQPLIVILLTTATIKPSCVVGLVPIPIPELHSKIVWLAGVIMFKVKFPPIVAVNLTFFPAFKLSVMHAVLLPEHSQ